MGKVRYRLNPETLRYDTISPSLRRRLLSFAPKGLLVAGATLGAVLLLSEAIDTPSERALKAENEQLQQQYSIISRRIDEMDDALLEIRNRDNNIYRIIFEAEPMPDEMSRAGAGGGNRYRHLEGTASSELVIETTRKLDALAGRCYVESKSLEAVAQLAAHKRQFLASVPSISPIADRDFKRFASGFGYRVHPIYKTRKMHTGVDLSATTGTPVFATGSGRVTHAGPSAGGYGIMVELDHGFGYKSLYAHLSKTALKKGQKVRRGQEVGQVGNTGRSVAPHLHYEVRYNNQPVDPVNYYFNDLTPDEYDYIVELSQYPTQSFD